MIYDKKYVDAWIKNHESGKDIFRVEFLNPFLKNFFAALPAASKILDIGCGWGNILQYIQPKQTYCGIDIASDFFDYIYDTYPLPNITLKSGSLPKDIPVENQYFDIVICSLVLHTVADLEASVKVCFDKVKPNGKLLIVDFNNQAEAVFLEEKESKIEKSAPQYLKGTVLLPSGISVKAEVFFHTEEQYESAIKKFGQYKKKYLGPLFVSYECTKQE